jgi:Uma2 family endonuclease
MTVEEFRALPEPVGDFNYELHHGELFPVGRPKHKHALAQTRLRRLLEALAPPGSYVEIEMPFRAVPEHDVRAADVGCVNPERAPQIDPEDNLHGAPDIVIEVLSPSNTASELYDKEKICLENRCAQFWVVDLDRKQVKVSTPDGHTIRYRPGDSIPLQPFAEGSLPVGEIF